MKDLSIHRLGNEIAELSAHLEAATACLLGLGQMPGTRVSQLRDASLSWRR